MERDASLHKGHRERFFNNFLEGGKLTTVQMVEAFLFYCFRRGDTNETAHRLLDKFGSFEELLHADESEMESVKGMGPASSKKLRGIFDVVLKYREISCKRRDSTEWSYSSICSYLNERIFPRLLRKDVECVAVILKEKLNADSYNLSEPDIHIISAINKRKNTDELSLVCFLKPFSGYTPPSSQFKSLLSEIGVDAIAVIYIQGGVEIEQL